MPVLIGVGVLWPFIVAAFAVLAMLVGADSDNLAMFLLVASFMGTPAVARCVHLRLPGGWSEVTRLGVAFLLSLPLVVAEVFLALSALAVVMASFGMSPA
jgi:hypothetical protein